MTEAAATADIFPRRRLTENMDSKRRSSARSVTGRQSHWKFYLEDGPFAVENYFLSVEIHDEALRRRIS